MNITHSRVNLLLKLSAVITLLLLVNLPLRADTLKFDSADGAMTKVFSKQQLAANFPLKNIEVNNPVNSKLIIYQGVLLTDILNGVFGDAWPRYEVIKFSSSDGYQPLIPVNLIKQHLGLIAINEYGQQGFSELERANGDMIDPGPFFLVWENINDKSAKNQDWLSWPWQLQTVTLTNYAREFPLATPESAADDKVKQGFVLAMQHCVKCHTINGEGGKIGPELNSPLNVTEYWQQQQLKQFIINPRSVIPASKMNAFYRDVDNKEVLVDQIIRYLQYMADHKINAKQQ